MAYIINKFNGEQLIVLEDGTIDTTTSLGLVGRNYVGYGETQNENFVYLLENFANISPPSRPLVGQLWFDTVNKVVNVYDGINWYPIGNALLRNTAPTNPNLGAMWLDTNANQLKLWLGTGWREIGPEAVPGFGSTKARSATLDDSAGDPRPVIYLETDDTIFAICTAEAFTINSSNLVNGFSNVLVAGINLSNTAKIKGDITGNAGSADKLSTARFINNVAFDGQQNITIKASTTNKLVKGTYLTGSDFDGSSEITWSVDATPSNLIGKVVARNSEGGFSAGTITANFVGNLTGNVNATSGTSNFNIVEANTFVGAELTGNAFSASQLAIPRRINGVSFDGTSDITVTAEAGTLTGSTLNPSVIFSNITSLGTLSSLSVADFGVSIGASGALRFFIDSSTPTIRSTSGSLNFDMGVAGPDISFVNAATSLTLGGPNAPAILGDNTTNLGITGYKFNNIFASTFKGSSVETSVITPAVPGGNVTANGNLVVTGNLTVEGNVTAVNSTEVTIEDKLINLASNATSQAEANGAGIYINGANASLMYSSAGNNWSLNKPLDMGIHDVTTSGLFRGTATSAQYADLAENYLADAEYIVGTVLEFGGEYELTEAKEETRKVAGVVSKNPAYLMNSSLAGKYVVSIALQGRVPCKVRGTIRRGDMIVSAGNGYAKSVENPQIGAIIGKALQDFDGEEGIIEVVVGRI
jgi:hypothetical protein